MATRKPTRSYRLALAAICCVATPLAAGAQTVRSTGSINNNPATWQPGTGTLPANATGSAVVAAWTNNAGTPNFVYKVGNDANANAAETTVLNGIVGDALAIPAFKANRVGHRAGITALRAEIASCTMVDVTGAPAGSPKTCRVTAGSGNFAQANKAVGTNISSNTGNVLGMAGGNTIETAMARASQTLSMRMMNGAMVVVNTPNESTSASVERGGRAVAFAVNRDPMPIMWSSPSLRSVTYDLSNVTLNPTSTSPDSSATTFFSTDTGFIDNTLDTTLPESSAQSLFGLLLGVSSDDGSASVFDTFSLSVPCASLPTPSCTVSDTLGGLPSSGLGKVTSDLLGDFQSNAAGVWGFALPFTLNVTLPGSASESVLFMTDEAFSMATATPEPSTWAMMLLGFAGLGVAGYRWVRAA